MYNIILDVKLIMRCLCDVYFFISVRYYRRLPVYVWLKASPQLARLPSSPGNHYPEVVCTLMVE